MMRLDILTHSAGERYSVTEQCGCRGVSDCPLNGEKWGVRTQNDERDEERYIDDVHSGILDDLCTVSIKAHRHLTWRLTIHRR